LRLEVFFALGVLFAAGWLPATPPPIPSQSRGEVAAPTQILSVGGYDVSLTVNPGAVGSNAYDVRVMQDGEAANLDDVKLRFALPEAGLYSVPLAMDNTEPGLFVSASGDVDRAATWQVVVDLDAGEGPPLRAAFEWPIVAEVPDQNARSAGVLNWISAASILAVALYWSGPRALRLAARLNWTPENAAVAVTALALTLAVSVAGFLLVRNTGRSVREQRDPLPELVNPIFADEEAVARGRELYASQCLMCHAENGNGARPLAVGLSRRTPPLAGLLFERQDDDLYRILEGGLVNRHNFGADFSSSDRWRIISFLRGIQ
jgi:mono/diheme cytochrome c family protein